MDPGTQEKSNRLTGPGIRSIARNAFFLMGSHWVNIAIRLCYVVFLARWLGPELYGLFNYAMSWYLVMLPLAGLGLGIIMGREIPRNPDRRSDVLSGTFSLRVISSAFCALLCALSGLLLEENPEARRVLLVFSTALMGGSIASWASSAFTAFESSQYILIFHSIFRFAELLFSVTCILLGGGLLGLSLIHSLSWWAEAIFSLLWIKRSISAVTFRMRKKELANYFSRGLLLGIFALSYAFVLQGPLILYRYTAGLGPDLGQLALAMQALILLASLPGFLTAGALPVLSRSILRGDGKARFFTESTIRVTIIAGTALGLTGLAVLPWFVEKIFGPSYGNAGSLLGWTLWFLVPVAVNTMIRGVFQARGEYAVPTLFSLAGASVLLLVIYPAISLMGPAGVIGALGLALLVETAGLVKAARQAVHLDIRTTFLKPFLTALAAAVVFLLGSEYPVAALPASMAVLLAGTVFLRLLSPEEIFAARHVFRSFSSLAKEEESGEPGQPSSGKSRP